MSEHMTLNKCTCTVHTDNVQSTYIHVYTHVCIMFQLTRYTYHMLYCVMEIYYTHTLMCIHVLVTLEYVTCKYTCIHVHTHTTWCRVMSIACMHILSITLDHKTPVNCHSQLHEGYHCYIIMYTHTVYVFMYHSTCMSLTLYVYKSDRKHIHEQWTSNVSTLVSLNILSQPIYHPYMYIHNHAYDRVSLIYVSVLHVHIQLLL